MREAIYYPDWLQTTPPLFIIFSRLMIYVFGESNTALRLVPSLAGVASVGVIAFLAWKLLKPIIAVIAVFLFVFSPKIILYSQSLKQYSTDILCTLAIVAMGYVYLRQPTNRSFYQLLFGFVLLSFLSYPVMLFLPFLFYCAMAHPKAEAKPSIGKGNTRVNWAWIVAVNAAGACAGLINYFYFIEPNKNSALVEFFPEGFYQGEGPAQFIEFYIARLLTVTGGFFFGGTGVLSFAAFLLTMFGFGCLWMRAVKQGISHLHLPVLLAAPFGGVLVLNVLGLFPLPDFNHRLLLFLFPITALVFCVGLQTLASLVAGFVSARFKIVKPAVLENSLAIAVFVVMLGLLLLFFRFIGLRSFFMLEHEDAHAAIAYLAGRLAPDDILYVHTSMREQLKLYSNMSRTLTPQVVNGTIGSPCCPRNNYRNPSRETVSDIAAELNALSKAAAGRQLWVLMTDRSSHWRYLQRNDARLIEHGLAQLACGKVEEQRFTGVYIGRFDCRGA
jgi:uncharacterized membrane protein